MYGKTMKTDKGSFFVPRRTMSLSLGWAVEEELTSDNEHVEDVDNTRGIQGPQDLDFSESRYRHTLLFVVHQYSLQRHDSACVLLNGLVDFAG